MGTDSSTSFLFGRQIGGNPVVPFNPITYLLSPGRYRKLVLFWLLSVILIVPTGSFTRWFEWTGIPISAGGIEIYLTAYIPMLLCVPMVLWLGYLWGAIPAYLSTFMVALIGGMPLHWALIFSLANPLGLALYAVLYQVSPIRTDLRKIESLVSFVLIALVASLASSAGAFLWAYTNQVGLNEVLPVWQGWWLGGWLQAVFIVVPALYLIGPVVERKLETLRTFYLPADMARNRLSVAGMAFVVVLVGYVGAARYISVNQVMSSELAYGQQQSLGLIQNLIDGLSYPLFIVLVAMVAIFYLGYRIIMYSDRALLKANSELEEQNEKLLKTGKHRSFVGCL